MITLCGILILKDPSTLQQIRINNNNLRHFFYWTFITKESSMSKFSTVFRSRITKIWYEIKVDFYSAMNVWTMAHWRIFQNIILVCFNLVFLGYMCVILFFYIFFNCSFIKMLIYSATKSATPANTMACGSWLPAFNGSVHNRCSLLAFVYRGSLTHPGGCVVSRSV